MTKVQSAANTNTELPKKKWKYIILSVALLLMLGLGIGGYWSYSNYLQADSSGPGGAVSGLLDPNQSSVPGETISLEPFLVNLADPGGRRYLKLKLDLEVSRKNAISEIERAMPRIRDAIILLLCSKTYDDLASPTGKQKLRQEILAKLQVLPGGQQIIGAYFTEFVAQ